MHMFAAPAMQSNSGWGGAADGIGPGWGGSRSMGRGLVSLGRIWQDWRQMGLWVCMGDGGRLLGHSGTCPSNGGGNRGLKVG